VRWSKCTACHHECYRETCDWCGAKTKPIEEDNSEDNIKIIVETLRRLNDRN